MTEPASADDRAATVVACCQLAPVLGDPAANRELAADAVAHAVERGAGVVVLPELVSSGYVFESQAEARASAEAADGATVALWARLAADHEIVIVGGFCELAGGDAVQQRRAGGPGRAALRLPQGAPVGRREPLVHPGERGPAGGTDPVRPDRGDDLLRPRVPRMGPAARAGRRAAAVRPDQLAGVPAAGRRAAREIVRVQADAAVNRMFIAACDRTGEERGVAWVGGSVIVDADGWPLAEATMTAGPITITAGCQLGEALDKAISPRNDVHADRRPALYRRVGEGTAPQQARSAG